MQQENEEWRPIPRWPNHEASSLGRIRRKPTAFLLPGHVLRQYEQNTGYVNVQTSVPVHILIAEAFYGVRPSEYVVNHKDGRKRNNRRENLEWVTRPENNLHAIEMGLAARGATMPNAKLRDEQVLEIRRRYKGRWGEQSRLAEEYGVSQCLISQIVRGEIWTHLGMEYQHEGVSHNRAKGRRSLTEEQVAAIKAALERNDRTQAQVAAQFGVSRSIVSSIATKKSWRPKNGRASGAKGQEGSEYYRVRRGERHPSARLTEADIRAMRAAYTGQRGQQTALARQYGVCQQLVARIVHRRCWKHVT